MKMYVENTYHILRTRVVGEIDEGNSNGTAIAT
jgi:hypothetical protein